MPVWLSRSKKEPQSERRRYLGQGLVEVALVAPVMVIMLMGTVDFARVYTANIQVTNAAREGAYYGSRSKSYAHDGGGVANAALADSPEIFGVAPTVSSQIGSDGIYEQITVTVTYPFTTLFNYPGVPDSANLSRTVTMRVVKQ